MENSSLKKKTHKKSSVNISLSNDTKVDSGRDQYLVYLLFLEMWIKFSKSVPICDAFTSRR